MKMIVRVPAAAAAKLTYLHRFAKFMMEHFSDEPLNGPSAFFSTHPWLTYLPTTRSASASWWWIREILKTQRQQCSSSSNFGIYELIVVRDSAAASDLHADPQSGVVAEFLFRALGLLISPALFLYTAVPTSILAHGRRRVKAVAMAWRFLGMIAVKIRSVWFQVQPATCGHLSGLVNLY